MGDRRQGKATAKRTIRVIDDLTRILGSVEVETVQSLRSLSAPLRQLAVCIGLFELSGGPFAEEVPVLRSIRRQLEPTIELVGEPNVVAPPFSPDLRQRVGYATGQLVAMRLRLTAGSPEITSKAMHHEADSLLVGFTDSWTAFRTDPSLDNLGELEQYSCLLSAFYFAAGLPRSEPRVKGTRKLCALLQQASDRSGDLEDVPALLREVTTRANELSRPTLSEHRSWLKTVH